MAKGAIEEEQLVVVTLADESYGIDIAAVQEIIRMQHISKVPRMPVAVEGVTNLRGRVIPVIDLRKRFGLEVGPHSKGTRIVVVDIGRHTVGLVVDEVSKVLRIFTDSVEPPSPVVMSVDSDFLRGIVRQDNSLVIMLSLDKILSQEMASSIDDIDGDGVTEDEAA